MFWLYFESFNNFPQTVQQIESEKIVIGLTREKILDAFWVENIFDLPKISILQFLPILIFPIFSYTSSLLSFWKIFLFIFQIYIYCLYCISTHMLLCCSLFSVHLLRFILIPSVRITHLLSGEPYLFMGRGHRTQKQDSETVVQK